ncbi:Sin3 associated polypeptide p18-domain-containing protein [Russula vinacea]|nr:Sin3 associated polypeptide p18-domain-containing protein [Russula vinacea]
MDLNASPTVTAVPLPDEKVSSGPLKTMEEKTPAGQPIVDREKTAPFLIRAFVKVGSYHRLAQFQDGPLPIPDELQIFTWKDATLFELLTTIRNSAPNTLEYRHPLARYSFRTIYADAGNRGQFAQKDLGTVYSRDTLGESGTVEQLLDDDSAVQDSADRQKDARTLDELRFVPGDYLCVAVMLPKNVQANFSIDPSTLKSPGGASSPSVPTNGWKSAGGVGRGGPNAPSGPGGSAPGAGRGGGHWRGGSDAPPQPARARGERGGDFGAGRGDRDRDRERDRGDRDGGRFRDERDRRPPLPRRESPPPRAPWGDRDRAPRDRRSPSRPRSRSRSRSPPPRRRR